jgi:hypothetical protein
MAYGILKVDNITFDQGGADQTVTVSGIYRAITSGVTVTGTISGAVLIGTTVSGAIVTGTTVNAVTVSSTTGTFGSITGTTITGTTINGATVNSTTGNFTSLTGVTTIGTTANFTSGVFTTQVSGLTVTGTQSSFTSGNFVTLSGATATFTSGIIASGTAAAPSLAILGDPDTGVFSPGANQLAVATNGTGRLSVDSAGKVSLTGDIEFSRTNPAAITVDDNGNITLSANSANTAAASRVNINADGLEVADFTNGGYLRFNRDNFAGAGICTQQSDNVLALGGGANPLNSGINIALSGPTRVSDVAYLMRFNTTNLYQWDKTSDFHAWNTGGSERLRIDSSGRLLVGTSTAAGNAKLQVNGDVDISPATSAATLRIQARSITSPVSTLEFLRGTSTTFGGDVYNDWRIINNNGGNLTLEVGSTTLGGAIERLRVTNLGRVLLGHTSEQTGSTGAIPRVQAIGSGGGDSALGAFRFSDNALGASIILAKSRSSTVGTQTVVVINDLIGSISFNGSDGTQNISAASLAAEVDGTPGTNDMPGRLVFSTTADGASTPTERMRIRSDGNIGIGTTTPTEKLTVSGNVSVSGNVQAASINNGPLAGMRNAIINGNFDIWQRGTSFSNPASSTYTADRWQVVWNGSGATRTVSQQAFTLGQTDVAGEPTYFIKYNQSVAGSGGTLNYLRQPLESVRTFAGQQVTVSFYAKAASATTMPVVSLAQFFGSGGSPSGNVFTDAASSVSITTSWQRFTYSVTLPSITGKTLGSDGNDWMGLIFGLPFNAAFNIDIAQVQVEPGPVATPFERRPIGTELALCQRYYETGVVGGATNSDATFASGAVASKIFAFMTEKRVAPTMTGRDSAGNDNRFNGALNLTGTAGQVITAGALVTYSRVNGWGTDMGAGTASNRFSYKYEASAEL